MLSATRRVALMVGATMSLAVVACSSGDDDADASDEAGQATDQATTTTGPPSAAEVEPDIEDLLERYGSVVNRIIAEPSVAKDPDHPLMVDFAELFAPGSDQVAHSVAGWTALSESGTTIEPINGQHPATVSRLDGSVELTAADEVRFPTCEEHRYLQLNARGEVDELVENVLQHGAGVAVRIDGQWRLLELQIIADGAGCQTTDEGEP